MKIRKLTWNHIYYLLGKAPNITTTKTIQCFISFFSYNILSRQMKHSYTTNMTKENKNSFLWFHQFKTAKFTLHSKNENRKLIKIPDSIKIDHISTKINIFPIISLKIDKLKNTQRERKSEWETNFHFMLFYVTIYLLKNSCCFFERIFSWFSFWWIVSKFGQCFFLLFYKVFQGWLKLLFQWLFAI